MRVVIAHSADDPGSGLGVGLRLESGAGIEHGLGSIGEVLERLRIPRGQLGVRLGDSFDSAALRDCGVDGRGSLLRAENGGGYGD